MSAPKKVAPTQTAGDITSVHKARNFLQSTTDKALIGFLFVCWVHGSGVCLNVFFDLRYFFCKYLSHTVD